MDIVKNDITTYPAYFAGDWQTSESNKTIAIQSPWRHETIGRVQAVTQSEVDQVIDAAKKAQKPWAKLSLGERGAYLNRWADELDKQKDDLATAVMDEVGKNYKAAKGEVIRTINLIRYTVQEALHMHGESVRGDGFPGGSKKKIRHYRTGSPWRCARHFAI